MILVNNLKPNVQITPVAFCHCGYSHKRTFTFGSDFLDYLQWLGTDDPSAYLSVPAAIAFQAEHDRPTVRQACHTLVHQALNRINDLTGLPPMYPHNGGFYHQMGIAALPPQADLAAFKTNLLQRHGIEIPCIQWRDHPFRSCDPTCQDWVILLFPFPTWRQPNRRFSGQAVGEVVALQLANSAQVTWCYVTDPEGNIIELQSWSG